MVSFLFFFFFSTSSKQLEVCPVCVSILVLFMSKAPKRAKKPKTGTQQYCTKADGNQLGTNKPRSLVLSLYIAQCFYVNNKDQVNHFRSQFQMLHLGLLVQSTVFKIFKVTCKSVEV